MRLLLHQGRARSPLRAATARPATPTLDRRARSDAPYLAALLLLVLPAARAQTADDYFNSGAHFYISNNVPEALVPVEQGLKLYPDDVKLKKLYELLKQQQQQQQQQQQSQQNQQNQSQQQQSKSQQNQQQQQQQQQSQLEKQNEQKQSRQQKPQPSEKSAQKQENAQGQPVAAGQMTPEEAKRLLDAQKGDEQFLQLKPQEKAEPPKQPIKDW